MSDPEVPDAIKKLKDAVEKNPEDGQAYLELGNAWLKELNGTEALNAFQKATRLQPDCAEAYFGLAKSFDALQRYEEMLDAFKEACWLKPDWPEAHYNLGLGYMVAQGSGQGETGIRRGPSCSQSRIQDDRL
jgi:tetratricopeptide (TPR) repeat protein